LRCRPPLGEPLKYVSGLHNSIQFRGMQAGPVCLSNEEYVFFAQGKR
jgi:hypothetical protein